MSESSHPFQLGAGYTTGITVDGRGRPNGWAVYDPAGEYLDTAYNLSSAYAFVDECVAAQPSGSAA